MSHLNYEWHSFGFEILMQANPREFNLSGKRMILRHNAKNVFQREIKPNSCMMTLLKELEQEGKQRGNKHICGFRWVAERTKIEDEFTVRAFVEENLERLLLNMSRVIQEQVETHILAHPRLHPAPSDIEMPDVPRPSEVSLQKNNPVAGSWPLILHSSLDRNIDGGHEWMQFLRMCQEIANTLGVSHQEAVYHNCIKIEMTRHQIPHISHYHCMQRMPSGNLTKIGECDLLVELGSGAFLVELKVCASWRRFENQIKKYINACFSVHQRLQGAAILNFHPKGYIECIMFDVNCRHTPSGSS